MDFKDYCKQLSDRICNLKEKISTEEATKNAFIMPFIQMLGYDVFNPTEVIPEMDCDITKKKGEKIDYAIMKDSEPIMLMECKHWEQNLDVHQTQLQRYFVSSKAKFGVLTNGIRYRFYTDLVQTNIMDDTPFLDIDFEDLKENQIEELKKFHKSYFDLDNILSTASELKYLSELKANIKAEISSPSPELVKVLAKSVYSGMFTQKIIEQFTPLVKRSFSSYFNDIIADRLNVAIKSTEEQEPKTATQDVEQADIQPQQESKIVTTDEELEGYYIVKSIVRNKLNTERITYRDAQYYFSIFCDDNNRKLLCRLYLNRSVKYIEFRIDGNLEKFTIESVDDIYNHSDKLLQIAEQYLDDHATKIK